MAYKIFIDGQEGTTGLKIFQRFKDRQDVELLKIDASRRKDLEARLEMVSQADITFLCLPDEASKEIAEKAGRDARILDTSTAHRTNPGWVYGLPELNQDQREKIKGANRVAVPGCHATGFILLAAPLISLGIAENTYPFSCHSITGYSGGGKKMIAQYEEPVRAEDLYSPRQYGMGQIHKHLPEMTTIAQLAYPPIFNPIVADYYCGMLVTLPLHTRLLAKKLKPAELHEIYRQYYSEQPMIKVMEYGLDPERGFLSANRLADSDDLQLFVYGHEERIILAARYDNLGKGASGAAVQCMNIMLDLPERKGLHLFKE